MVSDVPVCKLSQRIMETQKQTSLKSPKFLVPARLSGYFQLSSYKAIFFISYIGMLIKLSTKLGFFKKLLLKHPDFFTFGVFKAKGPTPQQLKESSFETVFIGKGYKNGTSFESAPNYEIVTTVKGPEMGYVSNNIN